MIPLPAKSACLASLESDMGIIAGLEGLVDVEMGAISHHGEGDANQLGSQDADGPIVRKLVSVKLLSETLVVSFLLDKKVST